MNSIEAQSPTHYEILNADPMATLDELESLFRQLAMQAETSGDHSNVPLAIEAFKVLRDPELRRQYDESLNTISPQPVVATQNPAAAPSAAENSFAESAEAKESLVKESVVEESVVEESVVEESVDEAAVALATTAPAETLSAEDELKLPPDVLGEHRRELLKIFYEKKRKDLRKSGIAIGGLDTIVPYSYELLESHLLVLAEKKWILREESGALSISASGCEAHEQNLTDGLVQPGQ